MKIMDLQHLCASNLTLIILNNNEDSSLRKNAETELKKRLKNNGWKYNDFLHFDDKVINQRGLEIENYLFFKGVDMQKLMETYFMYDFNCECNHNGLLFSERHLCNETDFKSHFFNIICLQEIQNLDKRLELLNNLEDKEILLLAKKALENREKRVKKETKDLWEKFIYVPEDLLCYNEAMYKLNSYNPQFRFHEFGNNYSEEKFERILNSNFRRIFIDFLNCKVFDSYLIQLICGLCFVKKDCGKLSYQKKQLLNQVNSGFQVDYSTGNIQKVLKKQPL